MKWHKVAAILLCLSMISGCSLINRLVYRIDINQGNYIDQSIIQDLRFGMSKEQIQYILGPPMIVDKNSPNIWYYVHWLKPGHNKAEQKTLILDFDNNSKLTNMKGDFEAHKNFFEPFGDIS